jgi:hypothetical protein
MTPLMSLPIPPTHVPVVVRRANLIIPILLLLGCTLFIILIIIFISCHIFLKA